MTPEELNKRIQVLEDIIFKLVFSDRYVFDRDIQLADGQNLIFAGATGTEIGTSPLQKIGFYGKTPVAQGGSISDPGGGAVVDSECRSAVSTIITRLESVGIIAT